MRGQLANTNMGLRFQHIDVLGSFALCQTLIYEALQLEDKVGTMLPCNVVVQEQAPQRVEVAAADPVASMMAIDNPDLQVKAAAVRRRRRVSHASGLPVQAD